MVFLWHSLGSVMKGGGGVNGVSGVTAWKEVRGMNETLGVRRDEVKPLMLLCKFQTCSSVCPFSSMRVCSLYVSAFMYIFAVYMYIMCTRLSVCNRIHRVFNYNILKPLNPHNRGQ